MSLSLSAGAITHPGRVRDHNEDAYVCQPERGLFAVIDGMGGEAAGEVAADMVRRALAEGGSRHPRELIHEVNAAIVAEGEQNPQRQGMGCVVTVARLVGDKLELSHVGDTRAYLSTASSFGQLTRDHTALAHAQQTRGLTEQQARDEGGRLHAVTKDVGRKRHPDPSWIDVTPPAELLEFPKGALLLLCSDGLHDLVERKELSALLRRAREQGQAPQALAQQLVDLALERGGHDNITVLVVRSQGPAESTQPLPEPGAPRATAKATPNKAQKADSRPLRFGLGGLLLGLLAGLGAGWFLATPPPAPAPPPDQPQVLQVDRDARVTLAGLGLPAGSHPVVMVAPDAQLLIADSALTQPDLTLEFVLAEGASLTFQDSQLTLAELRVRGPVGSDDTEAQFTVRGSQVLADRYDIEGMMARLEDGGYLGLAEDRPR